MAHVRKGQLTASGEWRKHLRFWKRFFSKAERKEARRQAREQARHEAKARPPRRAFDLWADASTQRVMAGLVPAIHVLLHGASQMSVS
jgi:truncated hemoglobin YjbI